MKINSFCVYLCKSPKRRQVYSLHFVVSYTYLTSSEQFVSYKDNKLHFDEMMVISALF